MMKNRNIYFAVIVFIGLFSSSCAQQVREDTTPAVTDACSGFWKFHAGEGIDSLWMNITYNDSAWTEVTTAALKEQGVALENGFGWYRKTINLSESLRSDIEKKGAAVLHLGQFAATDEVYLNGKRIGKTGNFPPDYKGYNDGERNYLILKEEINLAGDNLIAVKFHDGWMPAGGFLEGAVPFISSAGTDDKLLLTVEPADSDYIFLAPDSISISVNLENKNAWPVNGKLVVTLTTDDYQPVKTDSINVGIKSRAIGSYSFGLANPAPGFYRYTVQFIRNGKAACQKKLNVGYEPEKISSPVDAQADFKAFWDNNLKELANVAPNYKLTLVPEYSQKDYDIYRVEMRSFGDELIRGYYGKPKREGQHPVIVEYMGYGSSPYPPTQQWDGFAYFILSIRGQALNLPENHFGTWITSGLNDKNDYYYRGAFLDVVRALDFVSSRPEIDAGKIAVRGGSQGGALSFVAASLDKRVKVAAPTIPFLSDYRDYFRITHWPKSDFDNYIQQHPETRWENVYPLLSYFDIKNLAQWIECPLIMGFGVQDDVCPPHTNFAAYNQVRSEKRWIACPDYGHSTGKFFYDESIAFIKEKLNVK